MRSFGFDYDSAAQAYMSRVDFKSIEHRCDALFIDEAQDMGPQYAQTIGCLDSPDKPLDSNSRD